MVEKRTLPSGVRIVAEHIPHVRSASIGLWVGNGSRHETPVENGASHFIEHMLFKGTARQSAAELAEAMDAIGGQMNAFTTKECTCYYGRVLDTHIRTALDILLDMFFHSTFAEEDVAAERGIIFEEIDMYEDTPDDLVTERLFEAVYGGSALGRPILGTRETLSDMDSTFLQAYQRSHYCPENLVVAISGNFTPGDLDYIQSAFSHMSRSGGVSLSPAGYRPQFTVKEKSIEQNHLCLAFPGLSLCSPDRYAMQLLSNILGGGMSSRLFQTVREQSGLCYSIYSFGSSYQDTGILGIYTALGRETEEQALALILDILRNLQETGVTEDELSRAREQVKSNVLMSLESTSARMNKLGKHELSRGEIPSTEDIIARYDAVRREDILTLAQNHFPLSGLSFSAVGQVAEADRYRKLLTPSV